MKKFFLKAFLLLLIIAAVQYYVGPLLIMDDATYYQEYKLRRMKKGENFEIIALGDSRAQAMSSRGYGKDGFYNYATVYYHGLLPYRYLLERYLKYNKPPKAILFSSVPAALCERQDYVWDARSISLMPLSQLIPPDLKGLNVNHLKDIFMYKYLYNNPLGQLVENEKYEKTNGALIYTRVGTRPYDPTANYLLLPDSHDPHYRPTPLSVRNLKVFLDLARERNIRVYFYSMPVAIEVYRDHRSYFQDYFADIGRYAKLYPNLMIIPFQTEKDCYPLSYFSDGTHLNGEGAEHFNSTRFPEVLASIRANLPTAR